MKYIRTKIADHAIEFGAVSSMAYSLFSQFSSEDEPEITVHITRKDLDYELIHYKARERQPFLSNARLEFSTLLRLLTEKLIEANIILLHGAAIAMNDCSYIFSAPSGTGKTTHIQKWLDNCRDAFVVNGDKPFLKFKDDDTVLACGSPWAGKENMYTNTMVPVKAIILMERAEDNHIEHISFAEAFPFLLQQVYRPEDEEKMWKTLRLMQRLGKSVTFWRFQCNNFKDDCFQVAYEALVGKSL